MNNESENPMVKLTLRYFDQNTALQQAADEVKFTPLSLEEIKHQFEEGKGGNMPNIDDVMLQTDHRKDSFKSTIIFPLSQETEIRQAIEAAMEEKLNGAYYEMSSPEKVETKKHYLRSALMKAEESVYQGDPAWKLEWEVKANQPKQLAENIPSAAELVEKLNVKKQDLEDGPSSKYYLMDKLLINDIRLNTILDHNDEKSLTISLTLPEVMKEVGEHTIADLLNDLKISEVKSFESNAASITHQRNLEQRPSEGHARSA